MAPNTNYTTLIVTTLNNQSAKIINNVMTNTSLTRHLRLKNNVKIIPGGRKFTHPLLYAKNSSFQARTKLETIDLPVTDPLTDSEWDIRILDGSIVLPTLDVAMNAGSKEKLLDFANAKALEAQVSMVELLSDQIWKGSPNGTTDFDSIPSIIRENVSESADVGGINQSSNTWWRNYSYDTAVSAFNTSNNGMNAIDTALNEATFGMMGPKIIVTTKKIFTLYMIGLSNNARYQTMGVGDAAFRELQYGTMPFIADDDCPTGNLYGIDTDNVRLQILAGGNFKKTEFRNATNQLVESALFYLFANLTCGSRRTNFVVDSITA